jgi:hypothetical protein
MNTGREKQPTSDVGVMKVVVNQLKNNVITPDLTAHVAFGMPYIGKKEVPYIDVVVMGVDGYCSGGIYPLQIRFISSQGSFYPNHAPEFQFLMENGVFGTGSAPCLSDGSYHQGASNLLASHPANYVLYSILETLRDGGVSAAGGIAIVTYHSDSERKNTIGRHALAARSTILQTPSLKEHCRQVLVDSWNIYRRNVVIRTEVYGCGNMEMKRKELSIPARFMTYLEPYPNDEELMQIRRLFSAEYMPYSDYWNFLNELGAVEEINKLAETCKDRRREWLEDWKTSGGDGSDAEILAKFRKAAWGKTSVEGPLYFPIPVPGEEPEWIRPGRGNVVVESIIKLAEVSVDDFGF